MSSINDVLNTQASTFDTSTATGSTEMGKEQFLQLLVTQLENQDPMNPMNNEEFVAQLAQFSSLEQLVNVNERLDSMSMSILSQNSASAVNFIGKDVAAMADWVEYAGEGTESDINFDLLSDAEDVTLTLKDDAGKTIKTVNLGAQSEGRSTWAWDGKNSDGSPMEAGTYHVEITAKNAAGEDVSGFHVAQGRVTGISYENGYPELLIGDQRLTLSDIIEVLED